MIVSTPPGGDVPSRFMRHVPAMERPQTHRKTMRYLSWLLSFLLHATVILVLAQTVRLDPIFELRDVMEVDLTEMETPSPVIPMPVPEPMPAPPPVVEPEPEAPPAPAALPMNKTVVLDETPPSPPEPDNAPEQVAPEPEVQEISPVKVSIDKGVEAPGKIIVRKHDPIVHRGHEARFGRSMMGDYFSYEAEEFSGQFTTKDDRTISIIDARNTKYGRFLIYDSKNKTLRRMKQFGKYVYTIGPSLHEDEPVVGSVTFLAKNDRIERFILVTDDDRIAHYPRKVHVREEDVRFSGSDGELDGYASLPPQGKTFPGVVFIHGVDCVEPGLIQGFTRSLSSRNLASLTFTPPWCGPDNDEKPPADSESRMARDAALAMDRLAAMPQVGPARTGIWGNGRGVPAAINAALTPVSRAPRFLVCLLTDTLTPADLPPRTTLAELGLPVLWLFTGRDTERWQPAITMLEGMRDKDGKHFSIVVAPLKASHDVLAAKSAQSGWVEQVAEDHARLAVSWISSVIR